MAAWDDFATEPPEAGPHPLESHEERSRLRLTLQDGRVIEGLYNPIAKRHFLHCTGRDLPPMGVVEGPLLAADILAVAVVMTRQEIREHARELLHGPRVPGREPVTRDDFEYRLQTIARAVAVVPDAEWQMQIRLKRQFDARRRAGWTQRWQMSLDAGRGQVGAALERTAHNGRPLGRARGLAILLRAAAAAGLRP